MKKLYKPKLVTGFSTCIYGIFLPKNTIYMRTNNGYIWTSVYDVVSAKNNRFAVNVLTTNAQYPQKMRISAVDGLGLLFTKYIVNNGVKAEKPIAVVNRHTMDGLLPKDQMVSKAYQNCSVYAGRETKVKRELYNV